MRKAAISRYAGIRFALAGVSRSTIDGRIVCALASLVLLTCLRPASANDLLDSYPGRLVSIGTHALHIDCRGSGAPTVVLESGLGGFSLEWHDVAARVAQASRVCVYDRAGYGWSDTGPMPRTASVNAGELRTLLANAGERPPFLIAAHSYGGLVARAYAHDYPAEVRGVVLLDAASPEQFEQLPDAVLPRALLNAMRRGVRTASTQRPDLALPGHLVTTAMHLMMLPKARLAYASELQHFEASAGALARRMPATIDAPLVIVTRGRSEFGASPAARDAERIWHDMQHRMLGLSVNADHWIAGGAGHSIHADRPDLAVLAIRQVAGLPRTPTYHAQTARFVDIGVALDVVPHL